MVLYNSGGDWVQQHMQITQDFVNMCKFVNRYASLLSKCCDIICSLGKCVFQGQPGDIHLGLENTVITWIGCSGMLWQDFDMTIQELLKT